MNQARQASEFSGAAFPHMNQMKDTNSQPSKRITDPTQLPFISQICFSNNFSYVACLISGSINRLLIYEESKNGKVKLIGQENFNLIQMHEDLPPSSPTVGLGGEMSRYTEKSKLSSKTLFYQTVTQVSFNPAHALSISFSGPACRLEYRKILPGSELEQHSDSDFSFVRQFLSEESTITCHSWSADGELIAVCTDDAQLLVYHIEDDEVILNEHYKVTLVKDSIGNVQEHYNPDAMGSLVSVCLFELGLVTASQDGHLFFYEVNADREFTQIRHW